MTRGTVDTTTITTDRETTRLGVREVVVGGSDLAWNESNRRRMVPREVPRDELFFWTAKWQSGERESEEQRDAGNTVHFERGGDLLDWLRASDD